MSLHHRPPAPSRTHRAAPRTVLAAVAIALLAACGDAVTPDPLSDPAPAATTTPPAANAVAGLRLTPSPVAIAVGTSVRVGAVPLDANGQPSLALLAGPVSYTTADVSIATVSDTGVVVGVAAGSTTLYARVGALVDSAPVTVVAAAPNGPSGNGAPTGFVIAPRAPSVATGRTAIVAAMLYDAAGRPQAIGARPVTWRVADETIARVSTMSGMSDTASFVVLHGVAPGSTTLSATLDGATATATVTVVTRPDVPTPPDSTPTTPPPPPVASFTLTAIVFAPGTPAAGSADTARSVPAVGANVTVYRMVREPGSAGRDADSLGTPTRVTAATADAAGRAVFPDLPSGHYRVIAEPPPGATGLREGRAEVFPPRVSDVRVGIFLQPRQ